jgi:hypothetical protein
LRLFQQEISKFLQLLDFIEFNKIQLMNFRSSFISYGFKDPFFFQKLQSDWFYLDVFSQDITKFLEFFSILWDDYKKFDIFDLNKLTKNLGSQEKNVHTRLPLVSDFNEKLLQLSKGLGFSSVTLKWLLFFRKIGLKDFVLEDLSSIYDILVSNFNDFSLNSFMNFLLIIDKKFGTSFDFRVLSDMEKKKIFMEIFDLKNFLNSKNRKFKKKAFENITNMDVNFVFDKSSSSFFNFNFKDFFVSLFLHKYIMDLVASSQFPSSLLFEKFGIMPVYLDSSLNLQKNPNWLFEGYFGHNGFWPVFDVLYKFLDSHSWFFDLDGFGLWNDVRKLRSKGFDFFDFEFNFTSPFNKFLPVVNYDHFSMPSFTIEDVNVWTDSLLIEKKKFENKFIKVMQTSDISRHTLSFPLPEGILDRGKGENFLFQAEAEEEENQEEFMVFAEDVDEYSELDSELFFEDSEDYEDDSSSYDEDSSFYTIFEDFYGTFSFHKLKNSQLDILSNLRKKRPNWDFMETLTYEDWFDIYMELDLPFFGRDKKFQILELLKSDYIKLDLMEELEMLW